MVARRSEDFHRGPHVGGLFVRVLARRTMGWTGRRAAWLSAVGFAIVLLNFLPISYFVTTSHTF